MIKRRWPSNMEYVGAVGDLSWCFADPELKNGYIRESATPNVPELATGQNAIVFPVHCGDDVWAVRCFTTAAEDCQRRYEALANYTAGVVCRPLVEAEWLEKGVRTEDTEWWPAIKMDWITGERLHDAVAQRIGSPDSLRALAEQWRATVRELRVARIAHGDLQHGNVLIENGAIRLVDYDGIWVPQIADLSAREVGHPNYQHPERRELNYWGEHVDLFSALVIYTSIYALAADPSLWDEFHNGENLVFLDRDYQKPGETLAWQRVEAINDADVKRLSALLHRACNVTVELETDLDGLLERGIPDTALPYPPANWWDPRYKVRQSATAEVGAPGGWGDWDNLPKQGEQHETTPAPPPWLVGDEPAKRDWRVVLILVLLAIAMVSAIVTVIIANRGG